VQSLYDVWGLILAYWSSLSDITRILVAMLASGAAVYAGTQAEETGWSAILFFAAFGIFTYVILTGYSLVQ
jgi:hypothetical protein